MTNYMTFSSFQPMTSPSNFVYRHLKGDNNQCEAHLKAHPRCLSSPARIRTMATSLNQNKSTTPDAVRDANTVIVGGGPTGLLTAIFMAQRNIPVTVVEQDDDLSRFDPLKAYALGINHRGLRTLGEFPSLLQAIKERGVPYRALRQTNLNADGTSKELTNGMSFEGPTSRIFHTRISLVELLQEYSKNFKTLTLLKQTRVTNVAYGDTGEMQVYLRCAEEQYGIRTKLLLACDGKNSIVSKTLRKAAINNSDLFQSSHGLGENSLPTPTTGRLVKSIALREEYVANELTNDSNLPEETVTIRRILPKRGLSSNKAFWFTLFPMSSDMSNRCGGRIATTVQPAESALWSLKTVDQGYELFDEVLPQLKARSYVSPENMKKFVEAKPLRLPNSTRVESLVVQVGDSTAAGGVVFLGDAAHSFPPDRGQGLNSAWEDVGVLMKVLDALSSDSTIKEFVEGYEMERGNDVRALIEYVRRSTGFVAERLSWSEVALQVVSSRLRSILSKRLPRWFSPSLTELVSRECSFSEAIRLYDETTVRLWACGISVIALPLLGLAAVLKH